MVLRLSTTPPGFCLPSHLPCEEEVETEQFLPREGLEDHLGVGGRKEAGVGLKRDSWV